MANWLSEDEYNFIFSRVPRPCVDIIIKSDDGILLSHRDIEPAKGDWHFPGGMIYKGESLEDAVKRIAKKETGLDVEITAHLGYMEFLADGVVDGVPRHSVSFVFETKIVSGVLAGDYQTQELKNWNKIPPNCHYVHKKFLLEKNILTL
jgi:ADP-ribose pyrophosphatase YjhB (NUDIX family)